jgi:tRNA1Val (adenine37-N6)-methyltransferase
LTPILYQKRRASLPMIDYSQPVFYRFNEDSLSLVNEIVKSNCTPKKILDVGAGSGIIGIELALKLNIPEVHFLELQKDWKPFLESNISELIPDTITKIFWSPVSDWRSKEKYDLIVSNPPYYLPQNGKISPDPVRAHCRSFLQDDWEIMIGKCINSLTSEGTAWFITPRENLTYILKCAPMKPEVIKSGELVILKFNSSGYKSKS